MTAAAIRSLKAIRWAVRATLFLGVTASVAANVLHAQPHLISQLVAAWPPVALLLTVELISRVPVHRKLLASARLIATTAIAGIAAWVSYWHMVGVAIRYGETGLSAYLLPVSVDGLIVVASISLVELSARLQTTQSQPPATHLPAPRTRSAPPSAQHPTTTSSGKPPGTAAARAPDNEAPIGNPPPAAPADRAPHEQPTSPGGHEPELPQQPASDDGSANASGADTDDEPHRGDDGNDDGPGDDVRQRRGRDATRKAVIDAYLQDPTQHPTAIAEAVGMSERTVRRYINRFRASAGTG